MTERFDVVPEAQQMSIRSLYEARGGAGSGVAFDGKIQRGKVVAPVRPVRFVHAPEKWGSHPFRPGPGKSMITIRQLPGSDAFLIQTVRWRDADVTQNEWAANHRSDARIFDYTQTLVVRRVARETFKPPRQPPPLPQRAADPFAALMSAPPKAVPAPNKGSPPKKGSPPPPNKGSPAKKGSPAAPAAPAPPRPPNQTPKPKDMVTPLVTGNEFEVPFAHTLEWQWLPSNAPVPREALFRASPVLNTAGLLDQSVWNVLYWEQTPLFQFHLEAWRGSDIKKINPEYK